MKNRIKYLDVAKFIGIFCIYLGHLGSNAGRAYSFVFSFHVALFFFLSGCTETLSNDIPWHQYVKKSIKGILLPYYFFALFALIINCIYYDSYANVITNLIIIFKGCIRNKYFASGLWFLTCLFIVKNVFYVLRKILKFKPLIFIVCLGLFIISETFIVPRPIVTPHMIYNIDSACYYIFFYALGYCCFDFIHDLLENVFPQKKVLGGVVGSVCLLYTALIFFGKNPLNYINVNFFMSFICTLLCPIIIIMLILIISKLLENIELFTILGKNTLFLCGSEYVIKLVVAIGLETVGLGISFPNPIAAYMYTFMVLLICNYVLIPIEKFFLQKLSLFH